MIKFFKNALTEAVANGEVRKGFPADLVKAARRKLGYLDAAITLDDLRASPANRLEAAQRRPQGPAFGPSERSIPDLLRLDCRRTERR
jgi:plasmid maintenance system killer protein